MTITLTPQNFEEKMKFLHSHVIEKKGVSLEISILSHGETENSEKSFQERMNDPENTSSRVMNMKDFEQEMVSWMK